MPVRRILLEMRPTDEPGGEVLDRMLVVYADDERVAIAGDDTAAVPCSSSPTPAELAAAICTLADSRETERERAERLERERQERAAAAAAATAEDDVDE